MVVMALEIPWGEQMRVHLSGQLSAEGPGGSVAAADFPGRQGRELFALLVLRRGTPVPRTELADALWDGSPPPAWDTALTALVSRLRNCLGRAGLDGAEALRAVDNCYCLTLPAGSWIDQDVAIDALHEAESLMQRGELRKAYGPSAIAWSISRRGFLPGSEAAWAEQQRARLRATLVRALEIRSAIYLSNGEPRLAGQAAETAIDLEPFRESAYRHLMRARLGEGNGAEAVRVYERCRNLLRDELGVAPSPETQRMYEEQVLGL